MPNPSEIKNKIKRSEVYHKQKEQKGRDKKEKRKREVEAAALGEEVPVKIQRTLESTREIEVTSVLPDDIEVQRDEEGDEFAPFFSNDRVPKIMITTRPKPSSELFTFIGELMEMIPNAFYYPRKSFTVKQICQWAGNKAFTHLFVLSEKNKVCNGVIVSVLPSGPTAFFKVTNVIPRADIFNHGKIMAHQPELILNNFNTRLGHRVGRFLGSMFPHEPHFVGRQVVTFHNQRDFIFVRHHRYIFEGEADRQKDKDDDEKETPKPKPNSKRKGKTVTVTGQIPKVVKKEPVKTRLQELGPRFTLKLKWLQEGTFDTEFGEYEWIHKRKEMDSTRRKFHL